MKAYKFFLIILIVAGLAGCTKSFEDINKDPNAITADEASAKYFITVPQYKLYAPDNYPYWRAQLIHADRFAGYFTFGDNYSWWADELGYTYHGSYTDAAWDFYEGYFGQLDNFLKLTKTGGDFENGLMYAVGLIMKGLYYQMFTETFGEIPYSEAGDPDIILPKYDTQIQIYKGIIADLDAAMTAIGAATKTGDGVNDLGSNDLYCNGDLQKWKRLANTLKLRIALRAFGATGDDFAAAAVSQCFSAPLLATPADNVLMTKDNTISKWNSDSYAGAWLDFGGYSSGGGWTVSKVMIDNLRNFNDPRLTKFVKPAAGGTFTFTKPASGSDATLWPKRVTYLTNVLTAAGADFTKTGNENTDNSVTFTVPANKNFTGQPVRLNGFVKPLIRREFFCTPTDFFVVAKGTTTNLYKELVLTTAEAYFLQAEAIVKAIPGATGNANTLFQEGINQSMLMWGCAPADITAYLAQPVASISSGSTAEKLEKIATQRWINSYTEGFEGWAIVRKMGYPSELANGVIDPDIYGLGSINGLYPERMQYGTGAYSKNGANLTIAIGRQGADKMDTKLWFSKP
ncbi:MAG: SusD/RagB family nutrient-binding outer membrane lipoprotein [Bacteroidia bacterium]|nr:MAG: SusD/RagB family nutrient-binding outer membrane lipoprotein [Bacteroidia bacterium]